MKVYKQPWLILSLEIQSLYVSTLTDAKDPPLNLLFYCEVPLFFFLFVFYFILFCKSINLFACTMLTYGLVFLVCSKIHKTKQNKAKHKVKTKKNIIFTIAASYKGLVNIINNETQANKSTQNNTTNTV